MRCGCSRSSATPTCGCSTAGATCGSPTGATPHWTSPPSRLPGTRGSSATTRPSARSRKTCWPTCARGRRSIAARPSAEREHAPIRAFRDDVLTNLGSAPLIDVRSPQEYTGERTHMPDYPEEGALRGGHIPTATSIPWAKAADDSGRFRGRAELDELYGFLKPDDKTIVYCRIGERSSHTWFVLTHLLGLPGVRNYDGSWTEWGNAVRVPVAVGPEPGAAPGAP